MRKLYDNFLVDIHAKCGKFEEIEIIFTSLAHKSAIPWIGTISAYVQNDLNYSNKCVE